jgi:hypothetical protein
MKNKHLMNSLTLNVRYYTGLLPQTQLTGPGTAIDMHRSNLGLGCSLNFLYFFATTQLVWKLPIAVYYM